MSKNNNGGQGNDSDPCGKDRDILCECKTDLIHEVDELAGAAEASKTIKESFETARDSKVCCVLKAEETSGIYRNINYYVAIDANCKSEQIEKNVGDLAKKSESLGKAIGEVVKCLKGIKSKAVELKAKACDLDTQIQDSCNSKQLIILNEHFGKKCQVVDPSSDSGDCFTDFEAIAGFINRKTKDVWEASDAAFNDAVSISGIQTFSNVNSLKDLSKTLAACVKDFKKNVDDNVKTATDDLKKANEELAACIKEVSLKTMEEHKYTSTYEGTAFALEFVCYDTCECDDSISDICCKVMDQFCEDVNCEKDEKQQKQSYSWENKD